MTVQVKPATSSDGSCTFCTSREQAAVKLHSTDRARGLVVYLCDECTVRLTKGLVDALTWRE